MTTEVLDAALQSPHVRAFLSVLRYCEGTAGPDGYRTLFGGRLFDSFADHPRQAMSYGMGGKSITSTAAGAYQFLSKTWDNLVKHWGFEDFSPLNQDRGAVALIRGRNALDDLLADRIETVVQKCNKEWASLPGSPYGQPVKTLAEVLAKYELAVRAIGGTPPARIPAPLPAALAPAQAPAPAPAAAPAPAGSSAAPTAGQASPPATLSVNKGLHVTPFVLSALTALMDIVPRLGKVFGSGSEIAERNVKAAELVVNAAKDAIGAKNEQELIESVKAGDPDTVKAVQEAVYSVWPQITMDFSGVDEARKSVITMSSVPLRQNMSFIITCLFMPLVYFVVARVLLADTFSAEVQSMVIAAVVSGVLNGIMGFWMGTSFSSQRKTEMLNEQRN